MKRVLWKSYLGSLRLTLNQTLSDMIEIHILVGFVQLSGSFRSSVEFFLLPKKAVEIILLAASFIILLAPPFGLLRV